MENNDEGSQVDPKKADAKRTVAHRFLLNAAKTPHRWRAEGGEDAEGTMYLGLDDAEMIVNDYEVYCISNFHQKHKAYIPGSKRKTEESMLRAFDNREAQITNCGKPASAIIQLMEEQQLPILCLRADAVLTACTLTELRVLSLLHNRHWKDIPNGKSLSIDADKAFETLCATLKLPRRTRAIINSMTKLTDDGQRA